MKCANCGKKVKPVMLSTEWFHVATRSRYCMDGTQRVATPVR